MVGFFSPIGFNQNAHIAIIAHVDHGKTTLVDQLLRQSGHAPRPGATSPSASWIPTSWSARGESPSSPRTRPSTGRGERINIVDTPGHADFGGEVERILSMVDSVLLLVDAVEGPMPQTRFVTRKAFERGLCPIVVINKIDRDGARPNWVLDQTFDLFDNLGASEQQLDFPVVYCSALQGYASLDHEAREGNMEPLVQVILQHCPAPAVDAGGPFQMQISSLDYSSYVGTIGVGPDKSWPYQHEFSNSVVAADGSQRRGRLCRFFS